MEMEKNAFHGIFWCCTKCIFIWTVIAWYSSISVQCRERVDENNKKDQDSNYYYLLIIFCEVLSVESPVATTGIRWGLLQTELGGGFLLHIRRFPASMDDYDARFIILFPCGKVDYLCIPGDVSFFYISGVASGSGLMVRPPVVVLVRADVVSSFVPCLTVADVRSTITM
jgi:hypothetical protein